MQQRVFGVAKIYYTRYEDEWEAEGFFDDSGTLLAAWHANDASWRSEYMDSLLEALGFTVVDDQRPEFVQQVKEYTGG